jgi:hypothetical protein
MNRINYNWVLECALLSFDTPNLDYLISVGASEKEAKLGLKIYNLLNQQKHTKQINTLTITAQPINPFLAHEKPLSKQNYYGSPISLQSGE